MKSTYKVARTLAMASASAIAAMTLLAGPSWAQSDTPSADGQDAAEPQSGNAAGRTEAPADVIVVTGSSIRGVPPTGSNLISLHRGDIEATGAVTTPDLLASVPQLNSFNTAPQARNGGFGSFAPGLRSLPPSATLVLMNGHRLVGAGANETNPDYPLIPNLAIQRVEIVADGASSIYGSDAIAGVVNFITRRRFDGVEASVTYGAAEDYSSFTVNGLFGHDWGSGSFLAAYQYVENDNITGGDRDYRTLDFRPYGGVDTRSVNCPSPNVFDGATFYAAPDFAPNTLNYCDNGAVADLFPASELHSLFLTASQDIAAGATVWADLLYSDRTDTIRAAPPAQTVTITAANPYFVSPPGSGAVWETVLFRPDNLYGSSYLENTDWKGVGNSSAGIDFTLPRDMNLSVYGTANWATNEAFIPAINPVALAVAAAGTTPDTALDPFGNGTAPDVAAAITDYGTDVTVDQRTYLGAIKVDGPLADLPGGELKVAAGVEVRRETFTQRGVVGTSPVPEDLERDIYSAYGELFVPIVGSSNPLPLVRSLSLSLSGRYDDYSDFGSTSNPKVGIDWEPVEGVTLRGTYGQSFRAPGMRQVGATVGAYYLDSATAAVAARDPSRGADQVNTVILLGGNKDLQPENARTYSFGIDWQPTILPDLSMSATFYDIEFTDVIGTPPSALVFTDPTFASIVYRDPSANQLASLLALAVPVDLPTPLPAVGNVLDQRLNNFGVRETRGMDFTVNHQWATGFGSVFTGLAGNYIFNFDTQLSPAAPVSDSLQLGVPRMTLRATAGFSAGAFSAVSFVNYRDGITNSFNTPTGVDEYEADPYTTIDLRVTWTLPDEGATSGTVLALQVDDAFDATPPFFPATDGIGGNYNPIGRYVALSVRKSF